MDRDLLSSAAYCSALSAAANNAPPEWLQLFPLGTFKPNDGREAWTLDNPQAVIAATTAAMRPEGISVDYDHGTERSAEQSLDSRAAGWIKQFAARGPNGESGLWARIEWTPSGAKAVTDKEYRYYSPSFMHSKVGNIVRRVFRVALTNRPALELPALASSQLETDNMDLKKLATALGLPETATADDCINAVAALRSGNPAMCAALKTIGLAAGLDAGKIGDGSKLGDNEVAAICTKLKTPATGGDVQTALAAANAKIDELQVSIISMRGDTAKKAAEADVDAAIASGKVTPAEREWALAYAASNPEGFKKHVGVRPTILSSGRIAREGAPAAGALTDDQLAMCAQTGVAPDKFKATLAANKNQEAE